MNEAQGPVLPQISQKASTNWGYLLPLISGGLAIRSLAEEHTGAWALPQSLSSKADMASLPQLTALGLPAPEEWGLSAQLPGLWNTRFRNYSLLTQIPGP